ncbi:hypothetical protein [Heyndrickxia oleronia]|uniref:Uncharacterized protein n=1 Tax=Heyndrickxia oleronia TaxID=38875 RepID=A0AAW6SQT2_9BACI|nr:hypothetical protein [Heyndrickxia oleronia]MDH5160608.1 hypothetical protein [Heyndrickxia oleronia]
MYKLVEHFKAPAMEANIFGDEVSKGTQKAVGAFLDLNKKLGVAIS